MRFATNVVERFEARWRRSITSKKNLHGIIRIRNFELVVPEFRSTDENPVFLLVTQFDFLGSGGSPLYGQPTPVKDLPKMKQLLRRFHRGKTGEHSDANPEPDDGLPPQGASSEADNEVFSQGASHAGGAAATTSQTQLGTQVTFSQAGFPSNRSKELGNDMKTERSKSIELSERRDVRHAQQPKKATPQQLLALLSRQPRGVNASKPSPMPPPPPPKVLSSPSQTSPAEYHSPEKEIPPAEEIENPIEGPASEHSFHEDDDAMVTQDQDDQVEGERGLEANESPSPTTHQSKPQDARPAVDTQLADDISAPNQTPTSYQIPVVSSSTVPTTNSSVPSVIQTGEKDADVETPRKKQQPFVCHTSWGCVLPAIRSVCRVPQDQVELLKKPNSILPSPVGIRFPMGNVPTAILMSITSQAEERSRKDQTATNDDDLRDTQANVVNDVLPSLDISPPDAIDDELLGSPSPPPTENWSSSPVEHLRRRVDLPPDSSLPEEQATTPTKLPERIGQTEVLPPKNPEFPSSPPTTSSQPDVHEDPLDGAESDLEMSVPTAYTQVKQAKTNLQKPKANLHGSSIHGGDPTHFAKRDVSSSGQMYTHLHQPEDAHPQKVIVPPSSSLIQVVLQPPQTTLCQDEHTSLSTSAVPCSIEASQSSPSRISRKIVGFDGAAESRMQSLPDEEDALIERQFQNEIYSQSARRQSITAAPVRDTGPPSSPLDKDRGMMEREATSAKTSPARRLSRNLPIKREALSPSPPSDSRKRAKKSHTNYHFSQESPISQDPSNRLREQRRQFYAAREQHNPIIVGSQSSSHSRQASNSSASGLSELKSGPSPAKNHLAQHNKVSSRVKQEPNEDEQSSLSNPLQTSDSHQRPPSSPAQHAELSRANNPDNAVIHDSDQVPLEADAVPHADDPDAMDVDAPAQEQFAEETEPPAPGEATELEALRSPRTPGRVTNGEGASSMSTAVLTNSKAELIKRNLRDVQKALRKENISADGKLANAQKQMLEQQRNLLQQAERHAISLPKTMTEMNGDRIAGSSSNRDGCKKQSFDDSDVEMNPEVSSSDDSSTIIQAAASSISTKIDPSAPQIIHEDHSHHDAPNDAILAAAEQGSAVSSPQQTAANHAPTNSTSLEDSVQPPPGMRSIPREEAAPPRAASEVAKPDDVFGQFSEAYPGYTGNRVHFENLCGQINWLRSKQPLHPFLWDDYIVRSRLDYKSYTDKCTNEGIDPLPWYKYYVDEISMPKFTKGIMNPSMLQNLFDQLGKASKPVVHESVPRVEQVIDRGPPPQTISRSDNGLRGGDNYRPGYSQVSQRTGPKNSPLGPRKSSKRAKKKQQRWNASPLRQQSNQPTAPSATSLSTSYPFNTTMPPKVALQAPEPPTQSTAVTTPAKTVPLSALTSKIARPVPQPPAANKLNSTPAPMMASMTASALPQPATARELTTSTPAPATSGRAASTTSTKPVPQPKFARTLNGMPLPPPPLKKSTKASWKQPNGIQLFKKKYEKPRPEGSSSSRAGSMAP